MRSVGEARVDGYANGLPLIGVAVVVALIAGGCAGARPTTSPPADTSCSLVPAPVQPPESAAVVLTWPVGRANVTRPSNPGERFVVEQAYETLVRVDCQGRILPGLAASWTRLANGGGWRFVLRPDARFWDGEPVTASDVIAGWRATGREATAALARRVAEGSRVVDDRTIDVAITDPLPAALGDPELAVLRPDGTSGWPEGTGLYRIRESEPSGSGVARGRRTLILEPVNALGVPRLVIQSLGASDARDAIDAGADLLLTDDPALAAYAVRGETVRLSLEWDRTFALLAPRRSSGAADSGVSLDSVMARTRAFRAALARDAVRADARAADVPDWWRNAGECVSAGPAGGAAPNAPPTSRIAFARDEPAARALAERLVAIAGVARGANGDTSLALLAPAVAQAGPRATTAPLAPDAFAAALAAGSELAFVLALPRRSIAPCETVNRLLRLAPWLSTSLGTAGPMGGFVPLVDTRVNAVARRDRLGLATTWNGGVAVTSSTGPAGAPR